MFRKKLDLDDMIQSKVDIKTFISSIVLSIRDTCETIWTLRRTNQGIILVGFKSFH